ncbi:MAG: hypothetical protein IPK13_19585 [Deltaproteobacteria bacterium]|nr:hypothetical protein [Deltaproteobacteria bacterium]
MFTPWLPRAAIFVMVFSACARDEPACITDRDCGAAMQCVANACVDTSPTGMCAIDDDCSKTEQCLAGHCSPIEIDCSKCAPEMICDSTTGLCRRPDPDPDPEPTCSSDETCAPPATICGDEGVCVPGCTAHSPPVCAASEACDPETGRCVAVQDVCDHDEECDPPRTICEGRRCVDGCMTSHVVCEVGTTCNADHGRCETSAVVCADDEDCTADQICDLASGDCVPSCAETGCTEPLVCASSGRCEPQTPLCVPDAWEPNDMQPAAGQPLPGLLSDLSLCPEDVDLFRVHLEPSQALHARATWPVAEGDLNLELLSQAESVVATGEVVDNARVLDFTSASGGDYALRVSLARDFGSTPGIERYTIDVTRTCDADVFEDNDTQETASIIDASTFAGLRSCPGDDDYYAVDLAEGTQASIGLAFSHVDGDIDLEVFDPELTLVAHSATLSDNESASFRAQLAGQYFIRVFMAPTLASEFGASYVLTVDTTSMTDVTFEITGVDFTRVGQNVHVVGSTDALGAWDPLRSVRLSGRTFPTWTRTVALPQGELVKFKAIIVDTNNNNTVTWESGANHEFTVPTTPTTIVRAWRP